jgi:hypothetical protein
MHSISTSRLSFLIVHSAGCSAALGAARQGVSGPVLPLVIRPTAVTAYISVPGLPQSRVTIWKLAGGGGRPELLWCLPWTPLLGRQCLGQLLPARFPRTSTSGYEFRTAMKRDCWSLLLTRLAPRGAVVYQCPQWTVFLLGLQTRMTGVAGLPYLARINNLALKLATVRQSQR